MCRQHRQVTASLSDERKKKDPPAARTAENSNLFSLFRCRRGSGFPAPVPAVYTVPDRAENDKRQERKEEDDNRINHAEEPGNTFIDRCNKVVPRLPADWFGLLEVHGDRGDID